MKLNMFVFRDRKAEEYTPPFFSPNKGVFLRDVSEQLSSAQKSAAWQKYPEDFELCEVGSFDLVTGEFETKAPVIVLMLSELLVKSN